MQGMEEKNEISAPPCLQARQASRGYLTNTREASPPWQARAFSMAASIASARYSECATLVPLVQVFGQTKVGVTAQMNLF
jgi:hypothetical protein